LAVLARRVIALLAALVLLIAGCGDGGDGSSSNEEKPTGIAGDWTGTPKQKGIAPFQVAARIDAVGSGRVAYIGIECGGSWISKRALASDPAFFGIEERIRKGAGGECTGSGMVQLHPKAPERGAPLEYEFSGGGVTSRGVLHRTGAAGIRPVFEQAGIKPQG
jgi:hypothetical protein